MIGGERRSVALGIVAYRDPDALRDVLASATGFDEVVVANVTADAGVRSVCVEAGVQELPIAANVGYAAAINRIAGTVSAEGRASNSACRTTKRGPVAVTLAGGCVVRRAASSSSGRAEVTGASSKGDGRKFVTESWRRRGASGP